MFSALTLTTAPTLKKIDLIQRVREVESEANSPIAILADLQGRSYVLVILSSEPLT